MPEPFKPTWDERQRMKRNAGKLRHSVQQCQPGCAEAITLLSELADVIEAVRGDRDLLRVSGRVGDRQDVGVVGIDGFIRTVRQAVARVEELTKALKEIARQKLQDELEAEFGDDYAGDFEGAYEAIVTIARKALALSLEGRGGAT